MTFSFCSNPFGGEITLLETTTSTMDDAAEHWQRTRQHGGVVCARHQTNGRGRLGDRQWNDDAGNSLLFTVTLDPQRIVAGMPLSLGAALSVARAIEALDIQDVTIKWPNDILVDGKKIAGILCQGKHDVVFCGIGVNVLQKEFSSAYRTPPTSLRLQGITVTDPLTMLAPILASLKTTLYNEYDWRSKVSKRLFDVGKTVEMQSGEPERGPIHRGVLQGIGDQGQAILDCEGQSVEVYSGEFA